MPHTVRYAVGDNRIDIDLDDGARSSLWWATRNEWLGLLDVAGLELEALYGGFGGEPLDDASTEYVFVAPMSGEAKDSRAPSSTRRHTSRSPRPPGRRPGTAGDRRDRCGDGGGVRHDELWPAHPLDEEPGEPPFRRIASLYLGASGDLGSRCTRQGGGHAELRRDWASVATTARALPRGAGLP